MAAEQREWKCVVPSVPWVIHIGADLRIFDLAAPQACAAELLNKRLVRINLVVRLEDVFAV